MPSKNVKNDVKEDMTDNELELKHLLKPLKTPHDRSLWELKQLPEYQWSYMPEMNLKSMELQDEENTAISETKQIISNDLECKLWFPGPALVMALAWRWYHQ